MAKLNLYRLLQKKDPNELSDTEVEIGYNLAKDKDVQDALNESIRNKNNECK